MLSTLTIEIITSCISTPGIILGNNDATPQQQHMTFTAAATATLSEKGEFSRSLYGIDNALEIPICLATQPSYTYRYILFRAHARGFKLIEQNQVTKFCRQNVWHFLRLVLVFFVSFCDLILIT